MRYWPPQPRTSSESYAHRASSEPSHTRLYFSFPTRRSRGRIRTWKLVLKTQVMAKVFEERVFKFRDIVTANLSYGISVPLIFNLKTRSQTKPNVPPFHPKRRHKHIESSHPPQLGHTTSHPQISHETTSSTLSSP
jgi:hypothetical protein